MAKIAYDDKAVILLPEPCPKCKGKVYLTAVPAMTEGHNGEWEATEIETECEHEPPIDSDEWEDWHRAHYDMPYFYWLPYHERMIEWLNKRYHFE